MNRVEMNYTHFVLLIDQKWGQVTYDSVCSACTKKGTFAGHDNAGKQGLSMLLLKDIVFCAECAVIILERSTEDEL